MRRINTEKITELSGQKVKLAGWVNSRRDHGGVIFVDLRDRTGLAQIVFSPEISREVYSVGDKLRSEYVIEVVGKVRKREEGLINPKIKTGAVEVMAEEIIVHSKAKTLPFEVEEIEGVDKSKNVKEELRLKYRYLDLRRKKMRDNLIFRHRAIKFIRDYLDNKNFLEIETPMLTKSTPEGARDFLVPSRLHPETFYSLPQSPQQYKQLLMVAGAEKYFQIARCFRDEDQRGNRQLEFTQLDLEMSFINRDEILKLMEDLFTRLTRKLTDKKIIFEPWPRLDYQEVMLKYGTDKPDLRYGLEIKDISGIVKGCGFKVFSEAIKNKGVVRAINATGAAKFSRSEIDRLTNLAKDYGAKGLAYIVIGSRIKNQESRIFNLQSPIIKFLGEELSSEIVKEMNGQPGDIIFFGADEEKIVREVLGNVRIELAKKLNLIDNNKLAFAFIIDFPLFSEELEEGHFAPEHHMFTMPKESDLELLDTDPFKVKSWQYDMVLNGHEVAGGSIRIHRLEIQRKIFKLIGFSEEKIKEFNHLLEAFEYGVPPHGGIALGLERMLMTLRDEIDIREVMAFPKSGDGKDLMIGAPCKVNKKQLDELFIKIKEL